MDDADALNPQIGLPFARCRFHFSATSEIQLPEWSASMWRGAFGHALRRISCMTRQQACDACPLLATCPYPAIFSPPASADLPRHFSQPPAPYLIEPLARGERHLVAGDEFCIDLALMGRSLSELPLLVFALKTAAREGLGKAKGTAALVDVTSLSLAEPEREASLFDGKQDRLLPLPVTVLCPPRPERVEEVTLRLLSPLRLQENGKALSASRLTPAALLMAAVRRAALVLELYGQGKPTWDSRLLLQAARQIVDVDKRLCWQDWARYSNRQQQAMQLGGVVGSWRMAGELAPFFPALWLCQWLHVGKETVFGLGRFELLATENAIRKR